MSPAPGPASPQQPGDPVDEAIAAAGGDARAAIADLLLQVRESDALAAETRALVSRGYVRGRFVVARRVLPVERKENDQSQLPGI